jgi:excisionase family DNA binding protein
MRGMKKDMELNQLENQECVAAPENPFAPKDISGAKALSPVEAEILRQLTAQQKMLEELLYERTGRVLIKDKVTLSIKEAAEYSNIGVNKLEQLLRSPRCPFVLYVGKKKLVKRKEFEAYIANNIEL